jgi:hypothetical protein
LTSNGLEDDDAPWSWPYLMDDISTNGLCEMMVDIVQSHCDPSVRERAKIITDWLGNASDCLSDECAQRVAAALEQMSSSSSALSLPASTTSGAAFGSEDDLQGDKTKILSGRSEAIGVERKDIHSLL